MAIDADDYDGSLPPELYHRTEAQRAATRRSQFVLCLAVGGHGKKLRVGKVYRVAKAVRGDGATSLRIVNDKGEVAHYPMGWFVPIALPATAKKALLISAAA